MKMKRQPLDDHALAQLFLEARSYNSWSDRPLDDAIIQRVYELAALGPTTANTSPARFVFVRTETGRERLRPHINPGNLDKTMSAPCCVIIAYDTRFYEHMPQLFPSRDMSATFAGKPALIDEVARRSSTLEGAYLIMAARALGVDVGPMSGFNAETLDADFFPDGRLKSNFLCNLGYGTEDGLFPRNPRLTFEQACAYA
jgi:3-hydroxypropanoate dehydrogenase